MFDEEVYLIFGVSSMATNLVIMLAIEQKAIKTLHPYSHLVAL
jgi:hypothetical protein